MIKIIPLISGAHEPHRGTISLSKILILVRSISNLSMVKKTSWFCDGKTFNFLRKQGSKLEILKSERYFQFSLGYNLWYIQARKLEFSIYVLYSKYYTKIKNQTVIGKF